MREAEARSSRARIDCLDCRNRARRECDRDEVSSEVGIAVRFERVGYKSPLSSPSLPLCSSLRPFSLLRRAEFSRKRESVCKIASRTRRARSNFNRVSGWRNSAAKERRWTGAAARGGAGRTAVERRDLGRGATSTAGMINRSQRERQRDGGRWSARARKREREKEGERDREWEGSI